LRLVEDDIGKAYSVSSTSFRKAFTSLRMTPVQEVFFLTEWQCGVLSQTRRISDPAQIKEIVVATAL